MPVIFHDARKAELLSRRKNGQSIAALENLLEGKSDSLHMPFPPEIKDVLARHTEAAKA